MLISSFDFRNIIYRDIKPENILLDIDGHVRIGDFGLAKPDMDVNDHAYSFCGSPEYMAPEMLLKVGHTYTVDFYCLGALLYELVRFNKNRDNILNKNSNQRVREYLLVHVHFSCFDIFALLFIHLGDRFASILQPRY